MPSLNWNLTQWDAEYDWSGAGEEWSLDWGTSEAQWYGALLPRIHRFFPAPRVLEIAPGYGRWTRFLLAGSSDYLGIDLSASCIDVCRREFAEVPHARFVANDGVSLDAAENGAFDFVFSFDSLVHAEMDVLDSYIPQILRKLSPKGVAFIHHSNLAQGTILEGEHAHSRAETPSVTKVAASVVAHGGVALVQETVSWMGAGLIDCLTTFARADGYPDAAPIQIENLDFQREAHLIRKYQSPYATL